MPTVVLILFIAPVSLACQKVVLIVCIRSVGKKGGGDGGGGLKKEAETADFFAPIA